MANGWEENGTGREELLQRVALMEQMIAEGRRTTGRYGWIFVMWGLIYIAAMGWVGYLPYKNLAWPVCVLVGIAVHVVAKRRQRVEGVNRKNPRTHSIESVWKAMGTAVMLFSFACIAGHSVTEPMFFSAMMFMVGLAHATSALILRWVAQGVAAAIWWGAGIAALFFTAPEQLYVSFMLATLFGMVLFGLYAMALERRRSGEGVVERHA